MLCSKASTSKAGDKKKQNMKPKIEPVHPQIQKPKTHITCQTVAQVAGLKTVAEPTQ